MAVSVIFHVYCLKVEDKMHMVPGAYFSFGTFQNIFRITSKHLMLFMFILSLFMKSPALWE